MALTGWCLQSCGPSVQTIYEGNLRFEHCYRLDLDESKAPSHRHACWRTWLHSYSYAQPSDRIEYARRRIRSLQAGDPDRPVLNLSRAHDPAERHWYLSGQGPVNAHAPPPAMLTDTRDGGAAVAQPAAAAATEIADAGPAPPEHECTAKCGQSWQRCLAPCDGDAGAPAKRCAACEPDYLSCMRRCLR